MKTNPLLSIVVPSFNSAKYLEECLASLKREKCEEVEYLFIDGGSTDATMDIIEPYREIFSAIISEPDRGQSHAFNKGFALAKGEYLTWLNSDDVLCVGAVRKATKILRKSSSDWLAANTVYLNEKGQVTRCCRSGRFESFAVRHGVLNVFGPSTFFSRSLFEKVGPLDESFHYAMDTDYWWRIVKAGYTYERMNFYFWGLRLHEDAKTACSILSRTMPPAMKEEGRRIAADYFPEISADAKKRGVWIARLWRLMNLSYPKSYFDTVKNRGKDVCDA